MKNCMPGAPGAVPLPPPCRIFMTCNRHHMQASGRSVTCCLGLGMHGWLHRLTLSVYMVKLRLRTSGERDRQKSAATGQPLQPRTLAAPPATARPYLEGLQVRGAARERLLVAWQVRQVCGCTSSAYRPGPSSPLTAHSRISCNRALLAQRNCL